MQNRDKWLLLQYIGSSLWLCLCPWHLLLETNVHYRLTYNGRVLKHLGYSFFPGRLNIFIRSVLTFCNWVGSLSPITSCLASLPWHHYHDWRGCLSLSQPLFNLFLVRCTEHDCQCLHLIIIKCVFTPVIKYAVCIWIYLDLITGLSLHLHLILTWFFLILIMPALWSSQHEN